MIGGFFDTYAAGWDEAGLAWFEALLDEDDVDRHGLGTRRRAAARALRRPRRPRR